MGYVNCCKGTVGGMSIQKFKDFRDNMVENTKAMDPERLEVTKLADVEGTSLVTMTQINFPWPMANRVIVNSFYFGANDDTDGTYTQCSSSKGNEAIVEANKDTIGSDVVAFNHIGYIHIKD